MVGTTLVGQAAVRLRPAVSSDEAVLLAWRNAADSVAWSESGQPVDRIEHARWLTAVLEDPGRLLFIGERRGESLGMVRVDVRDAEGTVSIGVDPAARRSGVAAGMLECLTRKAEAWMQVDRLVARVHFDNTASPRSFERAGFVSMGSSGDFSVLSWSPPRLRREEKGTLR